MTPSPLRNPSSPEIRTFLHSTRPFTQMSESERESILRSIRVKAFCKGETIYNEGEESDALWLLYRGRVQILKFTSEGKPFALESLRPGELFGMFCRLGTNAGRYPCTAQAAGETVAFRIPDAAFQACCSRNLPAMTETCLMCSARLKKVQEMRRVSHEPAHVRIATILSRLHESYGPTLPFSKREIAEMTGATLVTTFRIFADFKRKNLLSSGHRKIQLKNLPALERTARISP